jgi:hypothetical protein
VAKRLVLDPQPDPVGPISRIDRELTMTKFVLGLVAAVMAICAYVYSTSSDLNEIRRDISELKEGQAAIKEAVDNLPKNVFEVRTREDVTQGR